jgi:hypothetical protein
MNLSIKGRITKKLPVENGVSKAGKSWEKQSFVIDTGAQYNPEICFQLFGAEKIQVLNNFSENDQVEVHFNLSSREYNGRYFHNIDAWKIENLNESQQNTAHEAAPIDELEPFSSSDSNDSGDLPF